jgi:hypothetical protein
MFAVVCCIARHASQAEEEEKDNEVVIVQVRVVPVFTAFVLCIPPPHVLTIGKKRRVIVLGEIFRYR